MVIRDREDLTSSEEVSTLLGVKAEWHARKEYNLKIPAGGRTPWKDAEYKNGSPVSIKACQPKWRFRLFEKAHDVITSQKGWYVFVLYRPETVGSSFSDTEINVLKMQRRRATTVTKYIDSWNKSGHDRGRQKKLQPEVVFDEPVPDE